MSVTWDLDLSESGANSVEFGSTETFALSATLDTEDSKWWTVEGSGLLYGETKLNSESRNIIDTGTSYIWVNTATFDAFSA
jgi:hypothetical protein